MQCTSKYFRNISKHENKYDKFKKLLNLSGTYMGILFVCLWSIFFLIIIKGWGGTLLIQCFPPASTWLHRYFQQNSSEELSAFTLQFSSLFLKLSPCHSLKLHLSSSLVTSASLHIFTPLILLNLSAAFGAGVTFFLLLSLSSLSLEGISLYLFFSPVFQTPPSLSPLLAFFLSSRFLNIGKAQGLASSQYMLTFVLISSNFMAFKNIYMLAICKFFLSLELSHDFQIVHSVGILLCL